ncbi:MAG: hypothetical protein Q9164_001253 [Protoblastenia rupestris]
MSSPPPPVLTEMASENETTTNFLPSRNVDFESLTNLSLPLPLLDHIPKVAHFVHTKIKPLTWVEYAVIRSATTTTLSVSLTKIWIPEHVTDLPGEIWPRIEALPNVLIVRVVMPDTVWGKRVQHIEHQADLARIKILFSEGGIYLDTDMLPLKSSDSLIFAEGTRATVMARQNQRYDHSVSNAMIMSKPSSPFLRRWMLAYQDFEVGEWDRTSSQVPLEMAEQGDQDLTVLGERAWMYPMISSGAEVGPDPHLATMWLGKSWWDIEESFGVHLWKWDGGRSERPVPVTPDVVRSVDTPLFCRMRSAFDDLDGDGYVSILWEQDKSCMVSWMRDLREEAWRIFGDWRVGGDEMDVKWIDSSGHGNHGFAGKGTNTTRDSETGVVSRQFAEGDHAWLPVPADWDSRVGTMRISFRIDKHAWLERDGEVGLFKIRHDYAGEIVLTLKSDDLFDGPLLTFHWATSFLVDDKYKTLNDITWTSPQRLNLSPNHPNDLAISFDRKTTGQIALYLNNEHIANDTLPLIPSPVIGNEIWLNAREWKELDTGFRGEIYGLKAWGDVVPGSELMKPITALPTSSTSPSRPSDHALTLLILLLGLAATFWIWRAKISNQLRTLDSRNSFLSLIRQRSSFSWQRGFRRGVTPEKSAAYERLEALEE